MAEWLRSGLQNRLRRFNSGRGLHYLAPWGGPEYLLVRFESGPGAARRSSPVPACGTPCLRPWRRSGGMQSLPVTYPSQGRCIYQPVKIARELRPRRIDPLLIARQQIVDLEPLLDVLRLYRPQHALEIRHFSLNLLQGTVVGFGLVVAIVGEWVAKVARVRFAARDLRFPAGRVCRPSLPPSSFCDE